MPSNAITLPVKLLTEVVLLPPGGADFNSRLQSGETLTGTPTVSIYTYSGSDTNPSAMLSGAATISGTTVQQLFTGGVDGCIYKVIWKCATSLGQTLELFSYLVVQAEYEAAEASYNYIILPAGGAVSTPGGGVIETP